MSNEELKARELIQRVAQEKRNRLDGGGPDFQGSLKRLVAIWSDPSHALIELLQNADDAGARTVEYELCETGIIVRHDGRPFTEEDIWAICSVDRSTKDAETHTGFMGVGFKAVFKLSNAPHVFSGPYRFRFSPDGYDPHDWGWVLVPKWIETIPPQVERLGKDETIFWLPYKGELAESHRKRVEQAILARFDSLSLMFLRNVQGIFVTKDNGRVRELLREGDTVLETARGRKDILHQYRLFGNGSDELFKVPERVKGEYRVQESGRDKVKVRRVELAFDLDDEGNLRPLENAKLYVFLPTDYSIGLRFAVQGDFIFDTARSTLDETLEWNRWLWRCAGELLRGAVEAFKTDDKHRYQFYRVLPTRQDDFPDIVREELVEPFWEWCKQSSIIITSSGEWVKPEEAVIANQTVQELLDADKLEELIGRRYFVHPEVQGVKTFLTEVGAVEFKESQVLKALEDQHWVEGHNSQWFTRLYHFLWEGLYGAHDRRWKDWGQYYNDDEVKELPVVRTTLGSVKPANEVLFAPKASMVASMEGIPGIDFVDAQVVDETSRKLLQEWGVREFATESVVRVILRGFESGEWASWSSAEYNRCMDFLCEWLRGRDWQAPSELRRSLGSVRVQTQSGEMRRADECYFRSPSMEKLCPDGPFVVSANDDEQAFLKALGVTDKPRIRKFTGYYGWSKGPEQVVNWHKYFNAFCEDIPERWRKVAEITRVPVLAAALDSYSGRDPEAAINLLEFLVQHWDDYYTQYTTATYRWRYNRGRRWYWSVTNWSYFAWQLHTTPWLPTTKGLQQPSANIFVPSAKVKGIAGHLATYVRVPEGWDTDEFIQKGKNLFAFLGLRDEVDVEAALFLLKVAQKYSIDDRLRDHLARLYRHIGWLLAETGQEQVRLDDVALLTVKGEFKPATELIWDDDPAIGQHFVGAEGLDFVWIPEGVERVYLEKFLEAACVKRLSTYVQRQLVAPCKASYHDGWTSWLQDRARYFWSVLVHYCAAGAENAPQQLRKIKVFEMPRIKVLLSLKGVERIAQSPVFYSSGNDPGSDGPMLFLTSSPSALSFEVSIEICRAFGLSFDHASNIEMVVGEDNLEQIDRRFQQQGISLLDWDQSTLPALDASEKKRADRTEATAGTSDQLVQEDDSQTGTEKGHEETGQNRRQQVREYRGTKGKIGEEGARPAQREVLPYEERKQRESTNIERIIAFEAKEGREARDVSEENLGYDIKSTKGQEERHIEVKSSSYVNLTENEFRTAQEEGNIYWLYVVDGDTLYMIQDPANECEVIEIVETRWKIDGWRERGNWAPLEPM